MTVCFPRIDASLSINSIFDVIPSNKSMHAGCMHEKVLRPAESSVQARMRNKRKRQRPKRIHQCYPLLSRKISACYPTTNLPWKSHLYIVRLNIYKIFQTEGKKANIRALLCSLHTVVWEDCRWTRCDMSQLVTPADVKRNYRKACLAVHPDKVTWYFVFFYNRLIFLWTVNQACAECVGTA